MSDFGDELGGRNCASLEMHLEAAMELVWRCNWKPRSRDSGDALGGCDRVSLEMDLETTIERDWWSTRRWSIWRL